MGHRALILYQTGVQTFNAHYSHWGAHDLELCQRITAETPLGGDNAELAPPVGEFVEALAEAVGEDADAETSDAASGRGSAVHPDPIETDVTMAEAMHETIDEDWFEAVFVVTPTEDHSVDVTGFHVLRDLTTTPLLIEPEWANDGSPKSLVYDRAWFNGAKASNRDLVEHDVVDETTANERLLTAVLERYADSLCKRVFAHSPAIVERHLEAYPRAFFTMGGIRTVLGERYPSSIKPVEAWELPSTFPEVTTAEGETVSLV